MTPSSAPHWEKISSNLRVVRLNFLLQLLVPALIVPSLPRGTRGFTIYPGKFGLVLGMTLIGASLGIGFLLAGPTGLVGPVISLWILGTAGIATAASGVGPVAFVKPICIKCRLLPIIKEHEALHLSGIASEKKVWQSMRTRHSTTSLGLEGDPAICYFCPIPKRLSEH